MVINGKGKNRMGDKKNLNLVNNHFERICTIKPNDCTCLFFIS